MHGIGLFFRHYVFECGIACFGAALLHEVTPHHRGHFLIVTAIELFSRLRAGRARTQTFSLRPVVLRWGIAAALLIGLGLVALPLIQRYVPFGSLEATVQAAEGQVFQVADTQTTAVNAGAKLQKGEKVRTAKDGRAVVRLGDGSTIEMKDRSELYITKNGQGTTIHLDRGSIMVEAAKQKNGKLFVKSADARCTYLHLNSSTASVAGK